MCIPKKQPNDSLDIAEAGRYLLVVRIFARIAVVALTFLESIAHAALLPLLLQLLLVLLLLLLVFLHMVNPDDPPKNLSSIQVIYAAARRRSETNISTSAKHHLESHTEAT